MIDNNYSDLTNNILDRTNRLKENILNSMTLRSDDIIKGIVIFQEFIKNINMRVIDDSIVMKIERDINAFMLEKESRMQHINSYVHLGIERCFLILETYNSIHKVKVKKR